MSYRILLALAVFILLVISAVFVVSMSLLGKRAGSIGSRPDAPPYGMRGPYTAGIRDLVIDAETPLEITVWYPALIAAGTNEAISYPYEIKMGDPFGIVAIARFAGQAITDAPYDLSTSPYPLVILSPGFSIGSSAYTWLAEHLASYGFVVISPDHIEHLDPANELWQATITRPQDILTVFAYVDEQVGCGRA